MNEEQLRIFLEVVKYGSFRQVAANHYLSQRAVSQRIKSLEIRLNTKLFTRKANKIELTSDGIYFKKIAQKIIILINAASQQLNKNDRNPFSIGYFSQYNASVIQNALSELNNGNRIKLINEEDDQLIKDVQNGQLDCAIINDGLGFNLNFKKLNLARVVLKKDRILMKCSKSLISNSFRFFPEHLLKELPIAYTTENVSDYTKEALKLSLKQIANIRLYKARSFGELQALVANGQAISFCPESLMQREVQEGIAYLPIKNVDQRFNYSLIFKLENQTRPGIKKIIELNSD